MANANKSQNSNKELSKKEKIADSLRDEMELVNAATTELLKLKRQLRQTRSDLGSSRVANRKTIQRQAKGIEMLEKEREDCLNKLIILRDAQKPPQSIHKLIVKYHQASQQVENARKELQLAKDELKEKDNIRTIRHKPPPSEPSVKPSQDRLDQVVLQYNKILAKNTELRLQLEEMMKIKEEFMKTLKLLHNERSVVRTSVDRLYEENTILFQQREEFRLKLNLLRERLETTRVQGARDLNEYRRLLSNDEKLNAFLEQKNQERPCLEVASRTNTQQIGDDQLTQKMVDEWREALTAEMGHCNFEEIVKQYQHNLEQGYVLYGLIAQKNSEIDRIEDEISEMEQKIEHQRLVNQQLAAAEGQADSTNASSYSPGRQREQEITSATLFISKLQNILNSMEMNISLTEPSGSCAPPEIPNVLEQCNLGCNLLMERVNQMVASVTESTNKHYKVIASLATSQSSDSSQE